MPHTIFKFDIIKNLNSLWFLPLSRKITVLQQFSQCAVPRLITSIENFQTRNVYIDKKKIGKDFLHTHSCISNHQLLWNWIVYCKKWNQRPIIWVIVTFETLTQWCKILSAEAFLFPYSSSCTFNITLLGFLTVFFLNTLLKLIL